MADNSVAGFGKDPLVSHGDALADQSFQSLKSKEIRDSLSPTEMKFQSMALNNPNTTGWNVQSSNEISPDGRGYRAETLATTDGVESINGGIAEFKGRNEQRSSAHHQGDDKNFVKKAMESTNSDLQEKVVIGDENSGRTEVRTSSSKSTSSSQVIQSSTNVEYDDGYPIQQHAQPQKYLIDSKRLNHQDLHQLQQQEQQRLLEEQRIYKQQFEQQQQQRQQHLTQQERRTTEQVSTTRQNTEQKNISQNIETQEMHEQNKRYVDMDKASPEYQQHVQHLMQQPGEIISNTVEYPKPNVKMITTVKRLPDRTIVRNKRYETEELTPNTPSTRPTSTAPNQTQPRRDSQQQPKGKYQPDSRPHSRSNQDILDNNTSRYIQDTQTDDVETKFSSIKKSSNKFSTESTSETIQEFDEHHPQGRPSSRPKPKTNDFSTHGFPSVRDDKPTQEYATERPHTAHPTQSRPSRPTETVVPRNIDDTDNITERRINTKDGEVIIISSEKKHNFKTSTNSERIVETEHIIHDDQPYQQIPDKRSQDFTTHGFTSAREPGSQQPKFHPSEKQMQPHEQDFPLDKLPPGMRIIKGDDHDDVIVVSSQKSHSTKHSSNTERVIKHELIRDGQQGGYPHNTAPYNYTVTTPGEQIAQGEFTGSPRKPDSADYSTQGFPSVKSPSQVTPGDFPVGNSKRPNYDYSAQDYITSSRPAAGLPSSHNQHPKSPGQVYFTQGYPSVKSPTKETVTPAYPSNVDGRRTNGTAEKPSGTPTSKTQPRTPSPNKYKAPNTTVRETTERVIRKEREVDSAHRAFAASLRSDSPIDHTRRDSSTTDSHTRHTPRSSVSSTKTFRRDMREGSHDSAPSETSRISTTTVTRSTPPRVVGGRTVVTKNVSSKTATGSNDKLNVTSARSTKSPSPGKTVTTTTTTTTRTMTSKDVPKATEKSPTKKQSSQPQSAQPAPSSRSSTPSYNSRKLPTSVMMADDYDDTDDDDEKLKTISPFSSPSTRSRTPQKISPTDNDKPQDDRKMPRQPDNDDERRTVNRETTFEKTKGAPTQPHKTNFEQPNVEWVIVDDVDVYDHDDDDYDSNAFEVVDAKLNVRKTTTKLITQEKQTPVVPQRKSKPLTTTSTKTTTVTTKQLPTIPSKSQIKPNDKSPMKTKPNDSRTSPQTRTQKPLTVSKSPAQTPSKYPTKVADAKTFPKAPKPVVPSYASPLRKAIPKPPTEETTVRKTLKTSQVLREKTSKLIEAEKPKQKPQSPERKIKPQIPPKRKTNGLEKDETIVVTEITHNLPSRKPSPPGYEPAQPNDKENEPFQGEPIYKHPQYVNEDYEGSPDYIKPQGAHKKPLEFSPGSEQPQDDDYEEIPSSINPEDTLYEPQPHLPGSKKPVYISHETNHYTSGIQIPQASDNKPKNKSPAFRKPPSPGFQKLQSTFDEHSPQYGKPCVADDEPNQNFPVFKNPQETKNEPYLDTFLHRKPEDDDDDDKPIIDKPCKQGPQKIVSEQITITETSHKTYPVREAPKRPDSEPKQQIPQDREYEPILGTPGYKRPKATEKPYQGSPDLKPTQGNNYPQQAFEEEVIIMEKSQKGVPENQFPKRKPENKPGQLTSTSGIKYETYEEPTEGKLPKHYRKKPIESDEEPQTFKPEADDDDDCVTESESIILTSKKTVAKHIQKFETNFLNIKSPKPQKDTNSPNKQPGQVQNKLPKLAVNKTTGFKSPERSISPSRNQKKPQESVGKRPQSPTKHISPNRLQKNPTEPSDKRPKSPSKQTNRRPNMEMPLDDEYFAISSKTTKLVKEKIIKDYDDEEYPEHKPKGYKPKSGKPLETDDDEILTDNCEFVSSSTHKLVVSEKQKTKSEEPLHPDKKSPKQKPEPIQNKPDQNKQVEFPKRRAQSPNKNVSPTRTPKKSDQKLTVDDQTFRKTLRTTTDKVVRKVGEKEYPEEEYPSEKAEKPETKPKGRKPYSQQTSDTEDEEIITETSEFVVKSTLKQVVADQEILEFIEPERDFKSPIKGVAPTHSIQKPIEELPEDKLKQPTGKRPQSPNKHVSPTRAQKKSFKEISLEDDKTSFVTTKVVKEKITQEVDDEKISKLGNKSPTREIAEKRPLSPTKALSPTRNQMRQYPDKTASFKEGVKPEVTPKNRKPYYETPSDNEEYETSTKTMENFTSSKTYKITDKPVQEPQSPNQELPERKLTQEPGAKHPADKRPQSPTKSQIKPPHGDETYKMSLKTTKTVTQNTTKNEQHEHYPDKRIPYIKSDKPEATPNDRKPYSDKPYSDNLKDKTSRMETEKVIQTFEEPQSPNRALSPSRAPTQKLPQETGKRPSQSPARSPTKPDQISPEDHETFPKTKNVSKRVENVEFCKPEEPSNKSRDGKPGLSEPIAKHPKSPQKEVTLARTQQYDEDDQTFRKTLKTIQTVTENITETPKPSPYEKKPQESKSNSFKPSETDGDDESFVETTEFVVKSTNKPKYPEAQQPTDDNETFVHTSEFIRNTTQKLITTEQTLETENDLYYADNTTLPNKETSPSTRSTSPKGKKTSKFSFVPTNTSKSPEDRKPSPTRGTSPKFNKKGPKSVTEDEETFKKSLRKIDIVIDSSAKLGKEKNKPKGKETDILKPSDTDEEEITTENEELVIETCEKNYIVERNYISEEEQGKRSSILVEPNEKQPLNKPFTSTYVETIEGQTYPEDVEQLPLKAKYPKDKHLSDITQEPWLPKSVSKYTNNVNEQFIETERLHKETPDGAFISKTHHPSPPTSPTFKKKGAGRSDTFEERCRQILGMDNYGDTPGAYKKQPSIDDQEIEEKRIIVTKEVKMMPEKTTVFQVKIEDCDEDDEPLSVNSVKKTLHKQIYTTDEKHKEPLKEEPKDVNVVKEQADKPQKVTIKPKSKGPKEIFEPEEDYIRNKTKLPESGKNELKQTITQTKTIHKKTSQNKSVAETEPDSSSELENVEEKFIKEVKIIKKPSPTSSPRSSSPTKSTLSTPRSLSPTKETSTIKNTRPSKETPKEKPNKDSLEPKSNKKSPQKRDDDTTTIKDRLRSSTRKTKSPAKLDQVDGSESSPEHSPTRYTERRRSSNISVTTEIIIEHTDSDSPNKKEKTPPIIVAKSHEGSVFKEIIDSTVLPEKLTRRLPVTERKESAPVHRVTSKDKDTKMSRSTSENLIKVKKPEPHSLSPKTPTKTTDHRRPNKCFATKSINLSATDRFVNVEDVANVIIDIQHAKSSREPSPDKIVPTPVPAHLDTGKPRYPDVVQEPEDDQPKRKPQVKNIPIFEEENNSYVGCHITEVNVERSHTTTYDSLDYEQQISKNPVVEAPSSLDYTSLDNPSDDESLLTVHEKVNIFQSINTDVKKPKAKEPYQPLTKGDSFRTPQNDEYLVTITEKTEKKKKVKELVETEDEEFARNEHNYTHTTTKLAPTAPQKSPELVRTISKHISRQNEPDLNKEANEDYPLISHNDDFVECSVNNKNLTKEFKVSHHQKTTEVTANTAEKYQQPPKEYDDHDDDDELIPHTAAHTTILEERRQKDILSRPSVFDSKNKNKNPTATTKAPLKCNKSPVKDSEKLRSDIKSRTKPTSAVTNTLAEQNTATAIATTTVTALSNKPKQHSPQRKNSDINYELRGCNVETGGVKNIISKQTKVYNTSNTSSDSKANDLNKNITTSNKKPEKHMPVRLTPATNSDDDDLSADDEMIISVEERTDIDIESQVVNENLNKKPNRQIPLTTCTTTTSPSSSSSHKKQPTVVHSSTNSSPIDQPLKATKTKEHVDKLTDKNPLKSNTVTTSTSIKTYETVARTDDIDETVLEPETKKSPSHQPHTKNTKMSTTTTTDSVAARRSLFESNNDSSPSVTPTKRTPLTSPMSGRRPSYMDHTKSSLEHTRRDSLEINKTNYLRKPSQPEEEGAGNDRSSTVKFDVPLGKRASTPRAISVTEDINVEEIFDLEVLEKLLETVQSYEIRRRIRAQIRLIKKNQKNELISSTTEITTRTVKTSKVGSEEPDNITINNRKPRAEDKTTSHITQTKEAANHISSNNKKEYIFEEAYHPTTRRSPKPNRYPYEEEEKVQAKKPTRSQSPHSPVGRKTKTVEHQRDHSPDQQHHTEMVQQHSSRTTKQQHYYRDDHEHEDVYEIRHETSPTRKSPSPSRSSHSLSTSPERRYASPEPHKPLKANERNRSPQMKAPQTSRVTSSHSPDTKTTATSVRKSSANYEQQETVKNSTNKPQTKRMTTTTTTTTTKSKPEDKTPVWADRKNILKAPSSTTPKKPASSSTLDSRSGYTKTTKSTTSQKMTSNKSAFGDEDCITSSYGIGPTDENGLPLFGIRALKKKKSAVEPSETTEEVTGYVVEEKYYSDNKTKPKVERKEFIYSTNPEELQKLKEQVGVTTNRKALKDVDLKESRQAALISKATPALRSSPEDDFLDSASKYVRCGSVKEMSEKFIQKEASSTVTEKSNNYPKAGLILRTNSRKSSRDMMDNENENFESFKTTRVQQHHTSTVLADSDDAEQEYEVEEYARRHSGRFITESESECDSIKTQREFKKVTSSSSSSSMATRSFLNSQGEEKVVTNVSDCLERMRNADNVVEEGDTTEDQEARALLNKFLGASIIMKGVESSLPAATNRQSKTITTTTTSSNLSDDNDDGDNNAKHEVKTTRITKTIKSGSSSTPVTYTTCDIEEIWDEEILKELLEQARTYEERRKIRSRLRELMADREEQKQQKSSSSTTEKTETKEKDGAVVTTTTKVTTRTVTGSAEKPASPFAKFKQLDKQNSQQSAKTSQ